jgi:hypothetical protein
LPAHPRLLTFFLLVVALSLPVWLIGAATGLEVVEGLPVSALMAFCPLLAAVILTYRERGAGGVRVLLERRSIGAGSGAGSGTCRSCSSNRRSWFCPIC